MKKEIGRVLTGEISLTIHFFRLVEETNIFYPWRVWLRSTTRCWTGMLELESDLEGIILWKQILRISIIITSGSPQCIALILKWTALAKVLLVLLHTKQRSLYNFTLFNWSTHFCFYSNNDASNGHMSVVRHLAFIFLCLPATVSEMPPHLVLHSILNCTILNWVEGIILNGECVPWTSVYYRDGFTNMINCGEGSELLRFGSYRRDSPELRRIPASQYGPIPSSDPMNQQNMKTSPRNGQTPNPF